MFTCSRLFLLATILCTFVEWSRATGDADCSQEVNSRNQRDGVVASPGYPFPYDTDKKCRYTFVGKRNERIQLEFIHTDLNYPDGDSDNPLDCGEADRVEISINVDDGWSDLGVYCGSKQPPQLMSANNRMEILFTSTSTPSNTSGFVIQFNFITDYGMESGEQDSSKDKECVFAFRKEESSSGTFTSPNWPGLYPRGTQCHYLFHAARNETVHIEFVNYNIEGIPPGCEESTLSDYVEVSNYHRGSTAHSIRFCGIKPPGKKKLFDSDGSFFRVTFNSNSVYDANGFKAKYEFRRKKDPEPKNNPQASSDEGCKFHFRKKWGSRGTFTSPNYPAEYPNNAECHYLFHGWEGERVRIEFTQFDIYGIPPTGCSVSSQSDWVEVSNYEIGTVDQKLGRYCGTMGEGERIIFNSESNFFRVTFKSNDVFIANGFNATYEFGKNFPSEEMILT